jgi:hypothetical protein
MCRDGLQGLTVIERAHRTVAYLLEHQRWRATHTSLSHMQHEARRTHRQGDSVMPNVLVLHLLKVVRQEEGGRFVANRHVRDAIRYSHIVLCGEIIHYAEKCQRSPLLAPRKTMFFIFYTTSRKRLNLSNFEAPDFELVAYGQYQDYKFCYGVVATKPDGMVFSGKTSGNGRSLCARLAYWCTSRKVCDKFVEFTGDDDADFSRPAVNSNTVANVIKDYYNKSVKLGLKHFRCGTLDMTIVKQHVDTTDYGDGVSQSESGATSSDESATADGHSAEVVEAEKVE